jgi:hypothetical protein
MMKISLLAVGAAAVVLSGCASRPVNDVDVAKVATINRVAVARGIEVRWVNFPQAKSAPMAPGAPVTGT